ncbi:thiamine phosphate synthase [Microlunatus soli]|uniref:thiamine phosphate synthase n=1 Tax=Microlunatus soli TaxID=630515 RepID=UPI0012FAF850|nr:thiamine phosphate synthase [Microlunatus soli]
MNVLIGVGAQVKLARLMLVTDTRSAQGDLDTFLEAAVTGGVDLVQIRESGLAHDVELAALRTAWDVAARHRHLVVVSDSAELAGDFGADAVELAEPADHQALVDFKTRLGRFTRLGATARDRAELDRLLAESAIDFVLVDASSDLELAAAAAAAAPVGELTSKPWYAVGEFDLDRLNQAIEAGVRRITVTTTLTEAADPREVARQLSGRLREVWAGDEELTRLTFSALAEQA